MAEVADDYNVFIEKNSDVNVRIFAVAGVLAMLVLTVSPAYSQGDAQAGKHKNAMCEGCHAIEGFRTAYPKVISVPMIGGQSAAYIVSALKAYRNGDRKNPTMAAIAASLSDQDMEDLAAYYAASSD